MNKNKNNLSYRFFTPTKLSGVAIACLSFVVFWQQVQLVKKDRALVELSHENDTLKHNLSAIDADLDEIRSNASDVRLFQKELMQVMYDIDKRYPVSFNQDSTRAFAKASTGLIYDPNQNLKNTHETIFKLADSQHNLRFQTANLLGKAVTVREILSKTPSMMPVSEGYISSEFGIRRDPFTKALKRHNGIDIVAPYGDRVYASADGVITDASYNRDYGNKITIAHADGFASTYAHLSAIHVRKGDNVSRGQVVGLVGNTGGRCKGTHMHFEIIKDGIARDPKPFMITRPRSVL